MDTALSATRPGTLPAVEEDAALYEHDLAAWCERQATLLRQVAAAWAGQAQPDWPNLIEEIEDLGKSQRRQVESLLIQAMMHLLKIAADPNGRDVPHWGIEVRAFLGEARSVFSPSMRQALDLASLYAAAIFRLTGRRAASGCPYLLDDLLSPFPDVPALVARLRPDALSEPVNRPPAG